MATIQEIQRIRRRLEDARFPLVIERRIQREGVAGFLRTLIESMRERHRDVTRVVNTNTEVPKVAIGGADIPFAGLWSQYTSGSPQEELAVWRLPWGDVMIQGNFTRAPTTPAFSETIFTLPDGFRPVGLSRIMCHDFANNNHRIAVNPNGLVTWGGGASFNTGIYVHGFWRAIV